MSDSSLEPTCTQMLAGARNGDQESWRDIDLLYAPMIARWCRNGFPPWERLPPLRGVPGSAVADVVQNALLCVHQKIQDFAKDDKPAPFRRWLKAITRYKVLEYWGHKKGVPELVNMSQSGLANLAKEDQTPPDDEELGDQQVLLKSLCEVIASKMPSSYEVFRRHAVDRRPAKDVAEELGMTVGAVWTATSKVKKRLREELTALGYSVE